MEVEEDAENSSKGQGKSTVLKNIKHEKINHGEALGQSERRRAERVEELGQTKILQIRVRVERGSYTQRVASLSRVNRIDS